MTAYCFSDYESFIIGCYPAGVSNKHRLLSLFSLFMEWVFKLYLIAREVPGHPH